MPDNLLLILLAFCVGVALGCFYFSSLWITVRQLPTTTFPLRLFLVSWLFRIVITLLGFYVVMNGQWQKALICLAGFITARVVLINLWKPKPKINL